MTVSGLLFVVAFFVGLALAFIRNPLFGLLTYVSVFYLHPPSRWWGAFLPDLRWSMLAALVTLVATLRYQGDPSRPSWLSTTPAKLLLIYTVWLWIQNFWALEPDKHFECSVLFTKYLLVYYMFYKLLDTPEKIRWFYMVHILGCLYLGMVAWTTPTSGRLDGVGGPGIDDSNTLGMHISAGAIAAATMMLVEKKGWWALCALACAFSLNTMVMAGSRGAFLALLTAGMLLASMRPRAHSKKFFAYAIVGLLAFGAVASQQFWERMNTLSAAVDEKHEFDPSAESRIEMAKAQLQMAKLYPLGSGHRGSEALSARFLDRRYLSVDGARSSHNTLLTALVEQGIPGLILFLAYCVWGWRSALRLRKLSKADDFQLSVLQGTIAACSLLIVLVAGFFADFLKVEIQIWMAAILVVVLQMNEKRVTATATSAIAPARTPLPAGQQARVAVDPAIHKPGSGY
ncbi:MAG TPA: O-antigen ligase family protein [Povalibacter sp.]|nr:O-antigen ligase family protein [Povalibacter sp.]